MRCTILMCWVALFLFVILSPSFAEPKPELINPESFQLPVNAQVDAFKVSLATGTVSPASYIDFCLYPPPPEDLKKFQANSSWRNLIDNLKAARQLQARGALSYSPLRVPQTGTPRILVLLVDFPLCPPPTSHRTQIPPNFFRNSDDACDHFNQLLFSVDFYCHTGSLRDYFRQNSYNTLDLNGDSRGWYTAPNPYCYYTHDNHDLTRPNQGLGTYPNNSQGLVEDMINLCDPWIDYRLYDADSDGVLDFLIVIYPGTPYEARDRYGNVIWTPPDTFWPHKWATHPDHRPTRDGVTVINYCIMPENTNIAGPVWGIAAQLGQEDLWDYDGSSFGAGIWSLAADGVHLNPGLVNCGDPTHSHNDWVTGRPIMGFGGRTPVHEDPYHKKKFKWLQPDNPTKNTKNYKFQQVETNPSIVRLWTEGQQSMEYFLVENRRNNPAVANPSNPFAATTEGPYIAGFDELLPGSGLLIWFINEAIPGNSDESSYRVSVRQADGKEDLGKGVNPGDQGDPWPCPAELHRDNIENRNFTDSSAPDSRDSLRRDSYVRVMSISDSAAMMTADIYVEKPDLTVEGTSLAPPTVTQGDTWVTMLQLKLTATGTKPVAVTGVRVDENGSSLKDTDVYRVYLFGSDDAIFDRERDTLLAQGTFYSQNINLTGYNYVVNPGAPRYLFIVYDISLTATLGVTVSALLFDQTYITVLAPDSVALFGPGTGKPSISSAESVIQDFPDTVLAFKNPVFTTPAIVTTDPNTQIVTKLDYTTAALQQTKNIVMMQLDFQVNMEEALINGIKVYESGTSQNDSDVIAVKLYKFDDMNADNVLDEGDRLNLNAPLAQSFFVNQTATLTGFEFNVSAAETSLIGKYKSLVIIYDLSRMATVDTTVAAKLVNNTYVMVAGQDKVSEANFALVSGELTVQDLADAMTVSGSDLAPVYVYPGQKVDSRDPQQLERGVIMYKITLKADEDFVVVDSVKIKQSGTAPNTAVSWVKLYDDANNDNLVGLDERELGSGTLDASNTVTINITKPDYTYSVKAGTPRHILVTFFISDAAPTNQTLGVRLEDNTYIQVASPDSVNTTNFPLYSSPSTLTNILVVTGASLAPLKTTQGDGFGNNKPVVMEKLTLEAKAGTITIQSIRVDKTGTSPQDSDVERVYLYKDENNDNIPDTGGELGRGTFVSSRTTITVRDAGADYVVTKGTKRYILIVYDISLTASLTTPDGKPVTVGASVGDNSYLQVTGGLVDGVTFPLDSEKSEIQDASDTLTVSGLSVAPKIITQGEKDRVMEKLAFVVDQDFTVISSIKILKSGTSTDIGDVSLVKLFDNPNNNNTVDPGETFLGQANFIAQPDGTQVATISGLNYRVDRTDPANPNSILVLYNISDTAEVGKTIGVRLEDATYITVSSPDIVAPANFPIFSNTSNNAIIGDKKDILTVSGISLVPKYVAPGQLAVVWEQLALMVNEDYVTVNQLKVDQTDSGGDYKDIAKISLYDDANNNKKVDVGEQKLGEATFVGSSATIGPFEYKVDASAPRYLLLVCDMATGANTNHKLSLKLADNTCIGLVPGPDEVSTAGFPIQSEETTVRNALFVAGTSLAPPNVNRGQKGVVMEKLTLTSSSGAITVTSIKVDRGGTGTDADVDKVSVYDDANGNGLIDTGETKLSEGTLVAGSVSFTGLNYEVSFPTPKYLLLVYDISGVATLNRTLKVRLVDDSYVSVLAPNTASLVSPPIESGETTIGDVSPPVVVSAQAVDSTHVDVLFNELMDKDSAETEGNYSISPALIISDAVLRADNKTVRLTTEPQRQIVYTVTVVNVKDEIGNIIAGQNTASFTGIDTTPPKVLSAKAVASDKVDVVFNEPVEQASAETVGNYRIEGPSQAAITITAAALQPDQATVRLTTQTLQGGLTYKVTVNNVKDQATPPNTIVAPYNQATFTGAFTATFPVGTTLFSLPLVPEHFEPSVVLGIPTDRLKLARWDPDNLMYYVYPATDLDPTVYPNAYKEVRFLPREEVPGKSWWLKLDAPLTVNLAGSPVPTDQSHPIELKPGWNMIGNPFADIVYWDTSKIKVFWGGVYLPLKEAADIVYPYAWTWTPSGYQIVSQDIIGAWPFISPWKGYWIRAKQACTLFVPPPSRTASQETRAAKLKQEPQVMKNTWQVQLQAFAGSRRDVCNYFGLTTDSRMAAMANPPVPFGENYVDIYFIGKDNTALAGDFREAVSGKTTWRFVAETNMPNTEVTIAWPNLSQVPKGYRLTLIDAETGKRTYMRTASGYSFFSGSEGAKRNFEIEVELAASTTSLRISNFTVTPMRSTGDILISYTLSQEALCEVKILSLTGKLVRVLSVAKPSRAGINSLVWDTKDISGKPVPSGPYLCQVEAKTEENVVAKATRPILVLK